MEDALTPQLVDGSRQLAIEIKAQRELALSNPRNEVTIFNKAIAALEAFPDFAEDAYYSIPFGQGEDQEMVEGLSVVASREAVRLWGNCAAGNRIIGEQDDAFEVEGVFADFETNAFFRAVVRVPKNYIPRGTNIPKPLRADRMNTAIQAGLSKAERNATLKGLPAWFKERYFSAAKRLAGSKGKKEGKTDEQRLAACFEGFKKFDVDQERVKAYVAKNFTKAHTTDEIIGTMKGVFNALKDRQAKAEDVFPIAKVEEKKTGQVNLADIPGSGL